MVLKRSKTSSMGYLSPRRVYHRGSEMLSGLLYNKNYRIPIKTKFQGHPLPPAQCAFWVQIGGIFKSCPRAPTLRI